MTERYTERHEVTIRVMVAPSCAEIADEALVEAARQGDQLAFSQLVARYRKIAFAYAYSCLRDRDEAEDVAQEAFVRAYQNLSKFREAERWGAWVMRILRNHCTDTLRRRRTRKTETLVDEFVDNGPSPEGLLLSNAASHELRLAVSALEDKYRIPLLMHYSYELTYLEIAIALNIPKTTVVGRLARALQKLRRRLGRND